MVQVSYKLMPHMCNMHVTRMYMHTYAAYTEIVHETCEHFGLHTCGHVT